MKKLIQIRTLILFLMILITNLSFAQHFSTVWTGNPYQPMSIIIQNATIDGVSMETGDEIAVFDVGDGGSMICVGTTTLTSGTIIITAANDDPGGSIDGYTSGNTIVFKLWDNSESLEITIVVPTYNTDFAIVYTTLGTAIVNTLVGSTAIETTAGSPTICQGSFSVPIDVSNFSDITAVSILLDYETTNLSYTGYQNANAQLSSGTLSVTDYSGEIWIEWNSTTPANINSGTLLELVFTAGTVSSQSSESLIWNESDSYYLNSSAQQMGTEFTDGLVTINPIPVDAGSISGNSTVCQGTNGENYQVEAITNASSYVWEISPTNAGTITGSGSNIEINFSSSYSGEASLSVYGSNNCGDGLESSFTIDVMPGPTSDAGVNAEICANDDHILSGTSSNYSTVLWTTSGDGTFDNASLLTATYFSGTTDLSNGTVDLTLTASAVSPCASSVSDVMTLTLLQPPTADAGINDTIQSGGSTTLNGAASGGASPYTYLWSPATDLSNPAISNPVANPVANTTYTLTVTDNNSCTGSDDVDITVVHFMPIWDGNPYQPMNILLSTATVDGIDLNIGDEVGVFDVDGSGNEICVGAGFVSQTITPSTLLSIVVSADDPGTTDIDGFTPGNTIKYKAWSADEQEEYSTFQATYNPIFDNAFATLGTALVDVAFISYITQSIDLNQGWNIMSFYVEPDDLNFLNILQPLVISEDLIKVINEAGGFIQYIPEVGWMNTIGNMANTEGYYIKVANNTSLEATGMPIDSPFDIPLISGWNMMSFPFEQEQDAMEVLQPLIDNSELVKVINEAGGFILYIPGIGWMNTIGNLEGDEGYYIKVNTNTTLTMGGTPTWQCGDPIEDPRDGQTYSTVLIGDQCWMAENLNVGIRIDGANNQTDNSNIEKYCYNDDVANCDTYGGLYQWDEMMQYVIIEGVQGICPTGWHLPSNFEWNEIITYLGGHQLAWEKVIAGDNWPNWNGNNSSGLSLLPGGSKKYIFQEIEYVGFYWTSSEVSGIEDHGYHHYLGNIYGESIINQPNPNEFAVSVRCVKDQP